MAARADAADCRPLWPVSLTKFPAYLILLLGEVTTCRSDLCYSLDMHRVLKPRMSFVKLYLSRMETSSIWEEPPHARLLFIWFLGQADEDGHVLKMSPQTIARVANMPLADVEDGVARLEAPDPRSRTPTYDGRRLVPLDAGGWLVTNAQAYREMRTPKQVYDAERQAKLREGKTKSRGKRHRSMTAHEREVHAFDVVTGKKEWL